MQNPIQELLQCAVCLGQVNRPRVLPCFHSFCESCLATHIRMTCSNNRRRVSKTFLCPSCRDVTGLPSNGIEAFPFDFRLNKFTDALKEVINLRREGICAVCSTDDSWRPAVQFCADCQKYFCNKCSVKHHLTPVLSQHFMLDLPQGDPKGPACYSHPKEAAKYVCSTCTLAICVTCVISKHKFHSISHLNHTSLLKRNELHGQLGDLRDQMWSTQDVLFHLTCLDGRLKGLYEESRLQIKKRSRKLITKLLSDETSLLKDLEGMYDKKCSEIFKLKENCRIKLSSCESIQTQIGTLLRSDDVHELLIKHPKLLGELENTPQQEIPSSLKTFVKFKPGNFFKLGKLSELELKTESDRVLRTQQNPIFTSSDSSTSDEYENPGPDPSETEEDANEQVITEMPNQRAASYIPDRYPYKQTLQQISAIGGFGRSTGKLCLPYNICFTSDENIVTAENGNRRLQIFDKFGEHKKCIGEGEIIPRCVTMTTNGNIAITDELSKTIKIYNINGDFQKTLNPIGATFPFGLANTIEGQFVFTDMIFENVTIITQSGLLKRQFGSHGCLEDRFDNPGYLAVSPDNKIYVSDSSNHAIKVFDITGRFLFKFGSYGASEGRLRYPKAICFDRSGNVFVADSGNDRIVLFSSKGHYLGKVIGREVGIQRPTGLACSAHNLLAVSMPDINEIRVYKLAPDHTSLLHPDARM